MEAVNNCREIAARIAIEWPYTVEQVEMVVDAARGSEIVARKALEITKGFSNSHIALACMWARCASGDVKLDFCALKRANVPERRGI